MRYVICYDIFDNRRRNRVAKLLESYGSRVQDSVFECHLSNDKLARLKRKLRRQIHPRYDKLRYYPLCEKDSGLIQIVGKGEVIRDDSHWQL